MYNLSYFDKDMRNVQNLKEASFVEVADYEHGLAGQRDIEDFNKAIMPTTVPKDGFEVWNLNLFLKKDVDDAKNTPSNDTKPFDWLPLASFYIAILWQTPSRTFLGMP